MPINPVATMSEAPRKPPWQFSLGGLLGLVTTICIALAWLSIHRTEYALTTRCGQMPPTDHALVAWIQRQGVANVRVTRDADVLVVNYERRELLPTFRHLMPPLADLGYRPARSAGVGWTARTYSPLTAAMERLRDDHTVSVVLALTVVCAAAVYARWRLSRRRRCGRREANEA
jgi:hypothetical protein